MRLAGPKPAGEKAVQMIYEAPAAGRKQSLAGYRESGRGTGGNISHLLPSISPASVPASSPRGWGVQKEWR